VTVREDGEAEREKFGELAGFTTRVMLVVWVRLPLTPEIVSG